MDFGFDDEQTEISDLAQRILTDRVTPERLRELEGDPDWIDRQTYEELAKSNLLGIAIPEEFGGSGYGVIEQCLVLEQVGRALAQVPVLAATLMGAMPIARFGTPQQRRTLVPGVVDGTSIVTTALIEASEAPATDPDTTASRTDDGWVLRGVKSCVPAGHLADRVLMPARLDNGDLAVFVVDPTSTGVSIERQVTTNREPEAQITLDGVAVSDLDRLGGETASGEQIVSWIEQHATVGICALQLGVTQKATEETAAYTATREQFQRPLAHFQAVAHRAADMFIDVEGIRLTLWQAAWRLSEDRPALDEIAIAKFWASEGGHRVAHGGVHLHGGVGVDTDYHFHRYFVWAKKLEFSLGNGTQHLLDIGRRLAEV